MTTLDRDHLLYGRLEQFDTEWFGTCSCRRWRKHAPTISALERAHADHIEEVSP